MRNLTDFAIRQEYERIKELGDRLVEIGDRIDWEGFRPKLEVMFKNNTDRGGRPNIDVIVMLKSLFIQQLYNLSDEQLERELADRISFRVFLGTTEVVPDSTTIWKFRERLAQSGMDKEVWNEMQRQLDAMNLKVKKGIMQDATFITADPGHAKKDTPRGNEAKTRRSKDGEWAKKGAKSYFGFKLHDAMDENFGLVRRIEVTAADVHDSQIDLDLDAVGSMADQVPAAQHVFVKAKEQLHRPAFFVDQGDDFGRKVQQVGRDEQGLALLRTAPPIVPATLAVRRASDADDP